MKILPIINATYDNRMSFKNSGVTKFTGVVAEKTMSEVVNATAKLGGGAVLVYLLGTGINKANQSNADEFQIRDLTADEFRSKKIEITRRINDFKSFKHMDIEQLNKWNIQLFDYMLQNPEEYNDERYAEMVRNMTNQYSVCSDIKDKNNAEVALRMLEMPWFLKAHSYARDIGVGFIARTADNDNTKSIKLQMLDKLDEYKNTRIFSGPQEVAIVEMLKSIHTENGLKVALKLIENIDILDFENGKGVSEDCFKNFSNKEKFANIKLALIQKIEENHDELFKTPYFKNSTAGMLNNVVSQESLTFALKVLDNPSLFNSRSFADSLGNMIYHFPTGKRKQDIAKREIMYRILDAIKQKPVLFENKKFLKDLGMLVNIQQEPYGDAILLDERPIEIGRKNLFLIEGRYYNPRKPKQTP